MPEARWIIVTGLPGTGKTTLARQLASSLRAPLIAKDAIKETLIDCLGGGDAAHSRKLSDASFAAMFAIAHELAGAGIGAVLEGNFRPGEHEAPLRSSSVRIAQILCVLDEPERIARLHARAADPARHAGHRDADLARAPPAAAGAVFLDLPGERFRCDGSASISAQIGRWWDGK